MLAFYGVGLNFKIKICKQTPQPNICTFHMKFEDPKKMKSQIRSWSVRQIPTKFIMMCYLMINNETIHSGWGNIKLFRNAECTLYLFSRRLRDTPRVSCGTGKVSTLRGVANAHVYVVLYAHALELKPYVYCIQYDDIII